MLMKNKNNLFLYLILIFFSLIQNSTADEFDISASNIKLLQDSETIQAEGNVIIVGQDGITIEAEIATYDKKKNIINAKKSVKITDTKTNDEIKSDKILYLKNKEQLIQKGKEYYLKHTERLSKQQKEWHLKHPEYRKEYCLKNKERIKERKRQWFLKNRESILQKQKIYRADI